MNGLCYRTRVHQGCPVVKSKERHCSEGISKLLSSQRERYAPVAISTPILSFQTVRSSPARCISTLPASASELRTVGSLARLELDPLVVKRSSAKRGGLPADLEEQTEPATHGEGREEGGAWFGDDVVEPEHWSGAG